MMMMDSTESGWGLSPQTFYNGSPSHDLFSELEYLDGGASFGGATDGIKKEKCKVEAEGITFSGFNVISSVQTERIQSQFSAGNGQVGIDLIDELTASTKDDVFEECFESKIDFTLLEELINGVADADDPPDMNQVNLISDTELKHEPTSAQAILQGMLDGSVDDSELPDVIYFNEDASPLSCASHDSHLSHGSSHSPACQYSHASSPSPACQYSHANSPRPASRYSHDSSLSPASQCSHTSAPSPASQCSQGSQISPASHPGQPLICGSNPGIVSEGMWCMKAESPATLAGEDNYSQDSQTSFMVSDSEVKPASNSSDAQSDSGTTQLIGKAPKRKRGRPTGSMSAATPYAGAGLTKREKKKTQNRSAAARYRQKKRQEAAGVSSELEQLEDHNRTLRTSVDKLDYELNYLKNLLRNMPHLVDQARQLGVSV